MFQGLLKIASGEATAELPHVVVPVYVPLALPITVNDAMSAVSSVVMDRIRRGDAEFVALAHGGMYPPGEEPFSQQLVLLYGKFADKDARGYMVFDTAADEFSCAIMADDHDGRYCHNRLDGDQIVESPPLPPQEALKRWVAGFLNWNEMVPGLYRLRYCLIQG